jgi:hypothetical protein
VGDDAADTGQHMYEGSRCPRLVQVDEAGECGLVQSLSIRLDHVRLEAFLGIATALGIVRADGCVADRAVRA